MELNDELNEENQTIGLEIYKRKPNDQLPVGRKIKSLEMWTDINQTKKEVIIRIKDGVA